MDFDTLYSKYVAATPLSAPTLDTFSDFITDLLCNPPIEGDKYFGMYTQDQLYFLDDYFRNHYS